ncbi:MAG: BlaI/MecI/CopY family transcriptional regulator [Candidatus Caldarchaeum sp.]
MSRSRKRIKLEMETSEGDKISIVFEGSLNRDKLFQLADFLELVEGPSESQADVRVNKLTRVMELIEKRFPFSPFTSREVAEVYQHEYREPISLSTVSTYLARLAERGYLERFGAGNMARYRMMHEAARQENRLMEG